jgi:decaprenylphospho-beta-D-ribofuranose 2-oxidase
MTASGRTVPLAGWGRHPVIDCAVADLNRAGSAAGAVTGAPSLIPRGCGRAYGDAALNPAMTLQTLALDRLLDFDPDTGALTCEAGASLAELIDVFLPRGWFPAVTPGTKFVTVGGLIASDVHGKNHHRDGSFCDWLEWVELCLADGRIVRCSRDEHPELFAATCGGMGLTGLIVRARFRLTRVESAMIRQRVIRAGNLDAAMEALESTQASTYSVAWIDAVSRGRSLGRSVVFLGEHASRDELPPPMQAEPFRRPAKRRPGVPIDLPAFALSSPSVRLFNSFIYHRQSAGERLVDLDPYFYPLDTIAGWNRIYGRRGFLQYQCVFPEESSRDGLRQLLEATSAAGRGSFLAVLKRMGAQSLGMLSFPMPGYTLALDFPVSDGIMPLLARLDEIVVALGGRIYLAKDARMPASVFAAGYPRLNEFRQVRREWNLESKFRSALSERLEI